MKSYLVGHVTYYYAPTSSFDVDTECMWTVVLNSPSLFIDRYIHINLHLIGYLTSYRVAADDPVLMEDPVIKEIAESKGKSPAQILIRYSLQRGYICVPKSVTPSRIQANFEVCIFQNFKIMHKIHLFICHFFCVAPGY